MIGKSEDVIITATSTDPNTKKIVNCSETMKVILTNKGKMTIFQTGFEMNKVFSANYPGSVSIPLDMGYLGPNITFSVDHLDSK